MAAATENTIMLGRRTGAAPLAFRSDDRAQRPLAGQDEGVEARHFDPRDLMAGDRSTFYIGIGERVAEAPAAWIGMAFE